MDDATRLSRCTQCGADLPIDAPEGLCPACLIAAAAASASYLSGDEATALTTEGGSASAAGSGQRLTAGQSFGPYRIERLLGRGGMGDVYEAEHVEQGRRVALKVLNQRLTSPEDRARFLREGQLAASINHPHTCYIFGSEEILGVPAIAMELLAGGTLKDRVQNDGPLRPAQAVDVILQVIAGLDAAQAAGILHRDIKPANCFTDRDGTVKVGDFGLSISTAARDLSQMTGGFQGTPQFAAPEQLRGEALDVRADIYAVGVTLYYLLTAELPFDDKDLTTLVTRVNAELPRSPRVIKAKVPAGLAKIVLRCLAKPRAARPATYGVLIDALRPFGSTAPTPATLGLRFGAAMIDRYALSLVIGPINFYLTMRLLQSPDPAAFAWLSAAPLVVVIYYGVLEGLWGVTPGKRLCGLRVVRPDGQPPGVPRAMIRALIVEIPAAVYALPALFLGAQRTAELFTNQGFTLGTQAVMVLLFGLVFSTMRQRNGFAGLHDLATNTRVVKRIKRTTRPQADIALTPAPAAGVSPRYGPFVVTGSLSATDRGELLVGLDSALERPVWIHTLGAGAAAIPSRVRDLSRPGRLRWLSGRRHAQEAWDAYEALDGAPLVRMLDRPWPWRAVKYWLMDLARELEAGLKDGSLTVLALNRVWITRAGQAKLLDFRAPGVGVDLEPDEPATPASAQAFLSQVAVRAAGDSAQGPLPLGASTLVETLGRRGFTGMPDAVATIGGLLTGADHVARWRRAVPLAVCAGLPAVAAVLISIVIPMMLGGISEPMSLANALQRLSTLSRNATGAVAAERDALEIYIAGHFGGMVRDEKTWTSPVTMGILGRHRTQAARIVESHPQVSANELAAAMATIRPFLEKGEKERRAGNRMGGAALGVTILLFFFTGLAIWGVVWAFALRGGLFIGLMRLAVVTRDGRRASRWRTLARGVVAWLPMPVLLFAALRGGFLMANFENAWARHPVLGVVMWVAGALFVGGTVWSVVRPERGLQDRIAGTWLVPR